MHSKCLAGPSCRYRSESVPISQFHAMTPCSSATLCSWLWEESLEGEAE